MARSTQRKAAEVGHEAAAPSPDRSAAGTAAAPVPRKRPRASAARAAVERAAEEGAGGRGRAAAGKPRAAGAKAGATAAPAKRRGAAAEPAPRRRAAARQGHPPSEAEKRRAAQVIDRLDAEMPDAHIELDFTNEIELLVAVMLSAQCTDAMVNRCTPGLFAAYRSAEAYAKARPEDLHPYISRCGLYRNKAKNIVAAMQTIATRYGGRLPRSRAELEQLPGVGRKTAGVVAVHAFDGQAFPVDTHVGRLARRLGFTTHTDPDKVEVDMQQLLPPERWAKGHQLLVWHGRRCCYARKPACSRCPVADLCPRIGVDEAV